MALNKKKSRLITVQGLEYRWIFFENSGWNDLTIQPASGIGSKLIIQISWDQNNSEPLPYKPVKPSFVAEAIKYGLKNGWGQNIEGKPCRAKYAHGSFSTIDAEA